MSQTGNYKKALKPTKKNKNDMKKHSFPLITILIGLIYYSVDYLLKNYMVIDESITAGMIFILLFMIALTIARMITTKYLLNLLRLIVLIVSFVFLGLFWFVNVVYRFIFNRELDFLFIPVNWVLRKLNKKIGSNYQK